LTCEALEDRMVVGTRLNNFRYIVKAGIVLPISTDAALVQDRAQKTAK